MGERKLSSSQVARLASQPKGRAQRRAGAPSGDVVSNREIRPLKWQFGVEVPPAKRLGSGGGSDDGWQ